MLSTTELIRVYKRNKAKVHVQIIYIFGIIVYVKIWTNIFVQKLINVVTDNVIT